MATFSNQLPCELSADTSTAARYYSDLSAVILHFVFS